MSTQPISAAKLAANKANAQRSSGPRTAEGKSRVADNALKHGLRSARNPLELSAEVALPIERDEFQTTLAGLMDDFQPLGTLETQLVERLAQLNLRLNRAARMETAQFNEGACLVIQLHMEKLPEDQPARDNALLNKAFFHSPAGLKLLGQYESRISREFARTLTQLRQAQALRVQNEVPKLREQTQLSMEEPISRSLASNGQIAAPIEENLAEQTQPTASTPTRSHVNNDVTPSAEPRAQAGDTSEKASGIPDKQTQLTPPNISIETKPDNEAKAA